LETAFAVCYETLVVPNVIDLPRLIDLFSCGPARIFNLPGGTLRSGVAADVTLLDVDARFEVAKPFYSKAANSPFLGTTVQGRAVLTIVAGAIKHDIRNETRAKETR
jgi:dihydroorotase